MTAARWVTPGQGQRTPVTTAAVTAIDAVTTEAVLPTTVPQCVPLIRAPYSPADQHVTVPLSRSALARQAVTS